MVPPAMLGLIFSRDRAMQLDGALRSFFLHCSDPQEVRLCVIYKATSAFHVRQYAQLAREYAGRAPVRFIEQKQFRRDVLQLLLPQSRDDSADGFHRLATRLRAWLGLLGPVWAAGGPPRYVLFLVDDNIFVRRFSLRGIHEELAAHPDALGFSLRLGMNTTYCYALDKPQALPPFTQLGKQVLKYDWTSAEYDFGYPLEVSSSIYRLHELFPFLSWISFDNPNTLEGQLAKRARVFRKSRPHLLCCEQSATFCNPVNKVQTVNKNRARPTPEYSSERLSQLFDAGFRIKVEAYTGFVPNACHQEIELTFEKLEK